MSSTLAAALLIQLTALAVVLVPLRRRAIGLVGPAFVAIAVLYHGITELIQLASPFGNVYDPYASQALVDEWVLDRGRRHSPSGCQLHRRTRAHRR